jgi:F5/8 type C domain/Trehalase
MKLNHLFLAFGVTILTSCAVEKNNPPELSQLVKSYFKEDAAWYEANIPFFECSDKQIEQVYYYRWKLYKAHIRNVGTNQYIITEFINHVSWDRDPYCTINAASMHHIMEGRWLRDARYLDGYINNLYDDGGNNRRYSESIADATYARFLVNDDKRFVEHHLDSMKNIYGQWADHYDSVKNLYYIPAMPDATEYNIAAIDASGGKDGFEGGEAFRPTINSYQYANALAISKIAALKGDNITSQTYLKKALDLKNLIQQYLWNEQMEHFVDRYKVNNQYVKYWDFIRGRELAGFAPWYFNLPDDNPKYHTAWKHLTDTSQLLGAYGFRTNEPSYPYYFHQFLWYEGKRGSQWNGPEWPYQTSQAITGMANFLQNYKQKTIQNSDYLRSLRLFTRQHFLPDGTINLVENYDPNLGGPIVFYYWSNHYLHSSYNNLIISGLCGIQPSEGNTLQIHPLIDTSIQYFCLSKLNYHGHDLTVVYDSDGTKYKLGKGLIVFVDAKKVETSRVNDSYQLNIGESIVKESKPNTPNYALNINRTGFPRASASVNNVADSVNQAIDGRIWYFPEITNRWSTEGSTSANDWFLVDFGQVRELSDLNIYLFTDDKKFALPDDFTIEFFADNEWQSVKAKQQKLNRNTVSVIHFDKIKATQLRLNFKHGNKEVALVEVEVY